MSAYDHDLRVRRDHHSANNEAYEVDDNGALRHVCPGLFGGYIAHSVGEDAVDGLGFDTADEAIRSLIGDPR